jgi:hypothetical protein
MGTTRVGTTPIFSNRTYPAYKDDLHEHKRENEQPTRILTNQGSPNASFHWAFSKNHVVFENTGSYPTAINNRNE